MTLAAPPAAGRPLESRPIRIIFADDSAAMRTLARFTLSARAGFAVVGEASDGAEALQLVDSREADCVVLDVEMPGVGGFEALAELQQRHPRLPVVMLSGFSDDDVHDRARRGGAAAYLQKDNGLGLLPETVRRVTQPVADSPAQTPAAGPVADPTATPPSTEPVAAPVPAPPAAPLDTIAADMKRLEYVVSHDFAEPARILSGFSHLLSARYADQLDGSGRLFLENIEGAAARLQAMIDALLVFSRAGRTEPTLGPVDLDEVVAAVFRDVPAADAAPAQLRAGPLPKVVGDPALLKTVFAALVRNARLFNTSPTPSVTVEGRLADGLAVVTVSDNGIGIAEVQRESVFELFRRLNTREEYAGTGTGLTLCRRLLTMQHGTIALTSGPGGGTRVSVTLPAAAV